MNKWINELNKGDKVLIENRETEVPQVSIKTVNSVLKDEGVTKSVFVETEVKDCLLEFLPTEPTWSHRIMPLPTGLGEFLRSCH